MSGPKNVVDMRPGKGFTTSQSNEHLRRMADKESAKKAQWNYDPSRERLNFEIGKGGVVKEVDKTKSIPQRIKENIEARGIKDPNIPLINQGKDPYYRTVANFILGGNREVMRNLAFGNQKVDWEHGADNSGLKRMPEIEAWAKDAYTFMCKKYGEQNIAAFVVHLDEANPHVHCTVLPLTEKNKFSFVKTFMNGINTREALSEYMDNLHTEYAEEVGLKYGMERGDSTKETGAVHRTTEEYRRQLWEEAEKKREEVKNNTNTIESQKSTIETLSREIKHSTIRLKAIQTMIQNLETSKHDLELEIEKLNKDLVQGKISKEMADNSLALIQAKINAIDKKILDKHGKLEEAQKKLDDAQEKLNEYQNRMAEKQQSLASLDEKRAAAEEKIAAVEQKTIAAEEKYSTVKSKFNEIAPSVNKSVMNQMGVIGFHLSSVDMETRLKKYNALKDCFSAEQRNILDDLFEGSVIGEVCENSANICAIATSLYLGYLDHATEISKSHGGGGGPGTGWGKKDDEDDLAFKRRCFGMAQMMMKPSRQSIGNRRGRH